MLGNGHSRGFVLRTRTCCVRLTRTPPDSCLVKRTRRTFLKMYGRCLCADNCLASTGLAYIFSLSLTISLSLSLCLPLSLSFCCSCSCFFLSPVERLEKTRNALLVSDEEAPDVEPNSCWPACLGERSTVIILGGGVLSVLITAAQGNQHDFKQYRVFRWLGPCPTHD